jgi:ribulose-phosphate 3-epimerase
MLTDPFSHDHPMILPSILSADFTRLGAEIAEVDRGGADFLHLDIMDGHFVPNISFGPAVTKAARRVTDCYLDAHLMISDPEKYAPKLVEAGADGITFHVELAAGAGRSLDSIYDACAATGASVGVALNPATPAEAVFPILDRVKVVLVMSVVPGFSGQDFMEDVLPKAQSIRKRLRPDQRLEMDGGMDAATARRCRDAGCDWFVAASAIFGERDRAAAIAGLRAGVA